MQSSFIGVVLAAAIVLSATSVEAQAQLQELSGRLRRQWESGRAEAESLAVRRHFPVRADRAGGSTFELQRLRNGIPQYYTTDNLNAAKTISTDNVWPGGGFGYSLSGSGITLGEWDAGKVRTTHQEFAGRVTSAQGSLHPHSTHVAGTMVAAGVSATRKGMSFQGTLNSFDWNSDLAEMAAEASNGLRVSNHSYGNIAGWYFDYFGDGKWAWFGDVTVSAVEDYAFGFYGNDARDWDNLAVNAPYYLMVKAAGNDRNEGPGGAITHWVFVGGNWVLQTVARNQDGNGGYDCLEGAAVAKNVLTVGAVNDLTSGYIDPPSVLMSSFSSWGPTDDGRIKPDVVANGVSLSSTLETADNAYGTMSGTSMAAPNVSGSVGLLLQMYKNMHGATSILSSTVKGLIIHTADEAGANPGPDYAFGWGLMNTRKAVQLMTQDSIDGFDSHIRKITVANHDTIEIIVGAGPSAPLRATLCWIDPAGSVSSPSLDPAAKKLVRDFDLRIIKKKR